jgi:hypothetical protein
MTPATKNYLAFLTGLQIIVVVLFQFDLRSVQKTADVALAESNTTTRVIWDLGHPQAPPQAPPPPQIPDAPLPAPAPAPTTAK